MASRELYYLVSYAPVCLEIAVFVTLLRTNLRREFPAFFNYITFAISADIFLLGAFHWMGHREYFYTYWITGVVASALAFVVIQEIFRNAFRPYDGLRDLGSLLFRWATVLLLVVAVLVAVASAGAPASRVRTAVLVLERSIAVMQCGLVLLLALFARPLGLSWGHRVFGIALGFGLYASIDMIAASLSPKLLCDHNLLGSIVNSAAYLSAVMVWTTYVLLPQPERRRPALPAKARAWNYALLELFQPYDHDGLMPQMEETVDRVLARGVTRIA